MEYIVIFVVAVVALVVGAACGYFYARTRSVAAETLLEQKSAEVDQVRVELTESRSESNTLRGEIASLRADNARLDEQLRQQAEERKNLRSESEMVFR